MFKPPHMSEAEWALIVELLSRERADLPRQIEEIIEDERTMTPRADVHERLHMLDSLLGRLRTASLS